MVLRGQLRMPLGHCQKLKKNYSHLDKEALALMFATKKSHLYLHGRHFTLTTDHKPLVGLLGPGRPMPPRPSGRMQRWILDLASYEYDLKYRPGNKNANADGLSRLPKPVNMPEPPLPGDVINLLEQINMCGLNVAHMKQLTQRDSLLSRVFQWVQHGWPDQVDDDDLKPFFQPEGGAKFTRWVYPVRLSFGGSTIRPQRCSEHTS